MSVFTQKERRSNKRKREDILRKKSRKVEEYRLRKVSGDVLGGRQKKCGCGILKFGEHKGVEVRRPLEGGGYFFSGLETCGSVWTCPVCSQKISKQRREDVARVLEFYQSKKNHSLGFLTLTTRHRRDESCKDVRDKILKGFSFLQTHRAYRDLQKQFPEIGLQYLSSDGETLKSEVGFIRALEIKYSDRAGWHPHLHIAFVAKCSPETLSAYANEIIKLWVRFGGGEKESIGQKYVPIENAKGISDYITKWDAADEIVRGHSKEKSYSDSVTPFQILKKVADGIDVQKNASLFSEYATAFRGKKQLTFSNSIARTIQISDEEIVKSEPTNERVAGIEEIAWHEIVKRNLQAPLLNAIEFHSIDVAIRFLVSRGVPVELSFDSTIVHEKSFLSSKRKQENEIRWSQMKATAYDSLKKVA